MTILAKLFPPLAGFALLSAATDVAHAQVLATRIDPSDISRVVVVRSGPSNQPRELKAFDGAVLSTAPAPTGRWVAAVVAHKPEGKGTSRVFRLHVLDETGAALRTVDHVQHFAFSPNGDYIAVIRGAGYEGGPGFFPESTEILGLRGPDLGPIEGLEKATELAWSTFPDDGLVLLARVFEGRSTILEYILKTNTVVPTDYLGLNFSPDGRYYYLTPGESLRANICEAGLVHDSCVRVFRREGYRPLNLPLAPDLRRPLGWADDRRLLLANERNHDCQLYNVVEGRPNRTVEAVDWRWNARPGFVVRRSDQGADFRKLGTPEIRSLVSTEAPR